MKTPMPFLAFSRDESGHPIVLVAGSAVPTTDAAGLIAAVPALATPAALGRYCDALNHFARGGDYRVIHDPAVYAEKYRKRLKAEDPDAPWQEGAPRLGDFGVCDTSEIAPPRVKGKSVIFYAEDSFLGIPYQVTGPAPSRPVGEVQYEPLPMQAAVDPKVKAKAKPETKPRTKTRPKTKAKKKTK